MTKVFNVTGDCKPKLHYMVNIDSRLREIKAMVDRGEYFTINRARQYGKTTTLRALDEYLKKDYIVISLDFQMIGADTFQDENTFSVLFSQFFIESIDPDDYPHLHKMAAEQKAALAEDTSNLKLYHLFQYLSHICAASNRPMVLLIDEVDSASNNQVFLDFLAQLRGYYINRDRKPTFQSVILASVYDIKNMKRKLRADGEHKANSPWNIAADFVVDMSFSSGDIAGMLAEYEKDHCTGMAIPEISGLLYDYTSGYPYLVSRLCKLVDERLSGDEEFSDLSSAWTKKGVLKAVRTLLSEPNTLFDSLFNKLEDYPELENMLRALLFKGREISYVMGVRSIEMALMFGFVKKRGSQIVVANRIFETLLYNLFLASPEQMQEDIYDAALRDKNQFVTDGRLNMKLVLEKFALHFHDIYGDRGQRFYEEEGRRYFMLYLKPIINGVGNYYIEAETRDRERTDMIVDYLGEQFIIETKVWYGNAYHMRGEKQLSDYLDYYHLKKGYMLSFNFNKTRKEAGVKEIMLGDKVLVEAVV